MLLIGLLFLIRKNKPISVQDKQKPKELCNLLVSSALYWGLFIDINRMLKLQINGKK